MSSASTPSTLAQKLAANLKLEEDAKKAKSPSNGSSSTSSRGRGGFSARGGRGRGGAAGRSQRSEKSEGDNEKSKEENENGESNGDAPKEKKHKKPYVPVEKCDKPDEKKYQSHTKQAEFLVAELTKKIEAVTVQIDAEIEKRKKYREENKEFYAGLKAASKERNEAFDNFKSIKEKIEAIKTAHKARVDRLGAMRKELKFLEVEELEHHIRALEYRIETSSMPLNAEKKLVEEIRTLKKQREAIAKYQNQENELKNSKVDTTELQRQLTEAKAVIERLKADEVNNQKEKEAQHQAEEKANAAIQTLIEQRKALQEQRKNKNQELWELKRAFDQQTWQHNMWLKQEEYRKKKEEWEAKKRKHEEWVARKKEREEMKAQRQAEWEARKAEREARKAEWEAEQKAAEEERQRLEDLKDPWEEEKNIVEDLVKYCKLLMPKSEEESKADEAKSELANLAEERNKTMKGPTVKVLEAKKNKHQLFPELAKSNKDNKPKAKKDAVKALTHVPDVIHQFGKVEVHPPLVTSDLARALTDLEAKREWLQTAPRELKKQKIEAEKKAKENAGKKKGKKAAAQASENAAFPSIADSAAQANPAESQAAAPAEEDEPEPEAPGAEPEAPAVEEPAPVAAPAESEPAKEEKAAEEAKPKEEKKAKKEKPVKAAPQSSMDTNAAEIAHAKATSSDSSSSPAAKSAKRNSSSQSPSHQPSSDELAEAAAMGAL